MLFNIDNEIMPLIVGAIRGVKNVKVENMADTLTDRANPASFTTAEIDWMKSTPISQVTAGDNFSDSDNGGVFFNLLVDNKAQLRISGRPPTNGEFRGDIVRKVIENAKSTNPEINVYQALQAHITNVRNNDVFIYASNVPILNLLAELDLEKTNPYLDRIKTKSREIVDAFGQSVVNSLEDLNKLSPENQDLNDAAYQFLKIKLYETIGISNLHETIGLSNALKRFDEQLQIIRRKSASLDVNSEAHKAAETLTISLSNAKDNLLSGVGSSEATNKLSPENLDQDAAAQLNIIPRKSAVLAGNPVDKFVTICTAACAVAQASPLKEHRGWKQVFKNIGFIVASIATLGIANIISKFITGSYNFSKTNTDSINKIKDLYASFIAFQHGPQPLTGLRKDPEPKDLFKQEDQSLEKSVTSKKGP